MSLASPRRVLLIGGSGFIGSHLAHELAARDIATIVPTRRYERGRHLILLPKLELVQGDVLDPLFLDHLCGATDVVVNLVGILHDRDRDHPYGAAFARAHVELPGMLLAAARAHGVRQMIQLSALHASSAAPSAYLRSKAAGEAALQVGNEGVRVDVLQPSVVFGPGDSFLNLFARLHRIAPFIPLACPDARFQPVFVGDVVNTICAAMAQTESGYASHPLCGPRVYTLRELVEITGRLSGRARPVIGLPDALATLQAWFFEHLPGPTLISRDNLASMKVASVSDAPLPFGLKATPLEAVAASWLGGKDNPAKYNGMRSLAGR